VSDLIELAGVDATSLQYSDNTLKVYTGSQLEDQIHFTGSYCLENFAFTTAGAGTEISYTAR